MESDSMFTVSCLMLGFYVCCWRFKVKDLGLAFFAAGRQRTEDKAACLNTDISKSSSLSFMI